MQRVDGSVTGRERCEKDVGTQRVQLALSWPSGTAALCIAFWVRVVRAVVRIKGRE